MPAAKLQTSVIEKPGSAGVADADEIQLRLVDYAHGLNYTSLSPHSIQAAKLRIVDTIGALLAGYNGEPCCISRRIAARSLDDAGATVIGTRIKTAPDMAAFANATTARQVNFTDTYHWPNSAGGHPSDVIMPVLAAAEYMRASGRDFILGVVLAYEVFIRISDVFHNPGYDYTTFGCLGAAVGAGKMLALTPQQLSHCISLAVVPNSTLRQTRIGKLTMWKATASGQAARAGVFAAMLAQEGMEGAHLPFTGQAGWCAQVAREHFALGAMGGSDGAPFKIMESSIKIRPCVGLTIASVLAAEKAMPLKNAAEVNKIIVESYRKATLAAGSGAHHWEPESAETADHSIPFLVATTLLNGVITPHSYDQAHLADPGLRALMRKIEVVENAEFTEAYETLPAKQCARITIETNSGARTVSEASYGKNSSSAQEEEIIVTGKFRALAVPVIGVQLADTVLERLLHLEDINSVAEIVALLVLD